MMRANYCKVVLLILCFAATVLIAERGLEAGQLPAQRPNIVIILADDIGYGDLGCYGQKQIKTPNLDRLAADGVRFTQAYAGCTVCAPSRCCLMTGMHTGHATIRGNPSHGSGDIPLRSADVTVAQVLKQAGYATGMFGKWGLGDIGSTGLPKQHGFDEFVGYLNHAHAHDPFPTTLFTNQEERHFPDNKKGHLGTYSGDVFTNEAVRFIREHKEQPFFLYLPYTAGHFEYVLQSSVPYRGESWPKKEKFYAAMATQMDRDIGQLLALLKELGLDERTIVFFSSDNGPTSEGGHEAGFFHSSGGLRGKKRDLYEGGIREPMIVRWPGKIKPGLVSDQVWAFWDFLPTAAELAGVPPPKRIDGISMLPVLLGKPQQQHDYLYWEFHEGPQSKQAIRLGDWKAVRFGGPGHPLELYDLKTDSTEQHNVAGRHRDVESKAENVFNSARTENALWPLKNGEKAKHKG